MEKKSKKKVKFFARITRPFLRKVFSSFKVYCLQSMGFSAVKKVFKQRFILS